MKKLSKTILFLFLSCVSGLSFSYNNPKVIVLGAMKLETNSVIKKMVSIQKHRVFGIPYTTGKLNGQPILVAQTGIGHVNAGIVASLLIHKFHPKIVLFSGVAGGLQKKLRSSDVVVATKTFDVNFGQYTNKGSVFNLRLPNPITHRVLPLIFKSNSTLLHIAQQLQKKNNKIFLGPIATDQHFPNNRAIDLKMSRQGTLAVAMEDSGIAQACWLFQTPFISVRGISDNIIENTPYTEKGAIRAATSAAAITSDIIKQYGNLGSFDNVNSVKK